MLTSDYTVTILEAEAHHLFANVLKGQQFGLRLRVAYIGIYSLRKPNKNIKSKTVTIQICLSLNVIHISPFSGA